MINERDIARKLMSKRGMTGPFVEAYHSASPPSDAGFLFFVPPFALDISYFLSIASFQFAFTTCHS